MNEQQKFEKRKQRTKIILITISVLFMIVMLVLPLFSVITNSLSEGFKFYVKFHINGVCKKRFICNDSGNA